MPSKKIEDKSDPRHYIAMNMMGDLFLKSITRFSPLSKLPKLTAVDERLKERALQAIQAKSPEDRKISVTKVSQLGPGNLWKGLDLMPQKISKSPGNQQRLQKSANQSPLNPQQRRYQTLQDNTKNQTQLETRMNQNHPKKPLQRNHNRAAQNNLNDSRNIGHTKQVTGNMVSQNLVRNQKSIRDDFSINDKSAGKKGKYSNEKDKSLNQNSTDKNAVRTMTESRALHDNGQRRVRFSPEKPKEHLINHKQAPQFKKTIESKSSLNQPPKLSNSKPEPYVYVPPTKRVVATSQEKTEHHKSPSLKPTKKQVIQTIQPQKKPVLELLKAITQSQESKIQVRKTIPKAQHQPHKLQKRSQMSPKKVGFNLTQNTQKIYETSMQTQKSVSIIRTSRNSNTQHTNQSKSQHKQEASYKVIESSQKEVIAEEMKKDWSKIKENLKYDSSLSPQDTKNGKKISQRQDIALKMIASLFLDASTRYFPGLLMLFNRGISKEEIEKIRSKSFEFNINISTVDRKSLGKPQPKTDRKLNWKDSSLAHNNEQNNSMYQGDAINMDSNIKKPQQVVAQTKSQIRQKPKKVNTDSENLERNNHELTRNKPIINRNKNELLEKSNLQQIKIQVGKSSQAYQPSAKNNEAKTIVHSQSQKFEEQPALKTVNVSKLEASKVVQTNKKQETKHQPSRLIINQETSQNKKPIQTPKNSIKITGSKPEIKLPEKQLTNIKGNSKQQKSTYVYKPPKKWEPTAIQPLKEMEIVKSVSQSLNSQKINVQISKKPEIKAAGKKQDVSKQLMQSKSQPNLIQTDKPLATQPANNQAQKPVAIQSIKISLEEKRNVNSGQNTPKNSEIKPNPKSYYGRKKPEQKKPEPNASVKNISVISSISQTSMNQQSQEVKKTPIQQIKPQKLAQHSKTNKNSIQNQNYVYQPPNKKDNNIDAQPIILAKKEASQTLKTVKSEKLIISKNIQSTVQKSPQPVAQKNQGQLVAKTSQQSEVKHINLLSKRFCTIFALIIKKRLSQNCAYSFQKIQYQAKRQSELLKHTSYLSRSIIKFIQNYENTFKRNAFKVIKTNLVITVNKTIKENKSVQENQSFSSGRKESAARVIFWFLANKVSSYFQPLRRLYFKSTNQGKVKQHIIQIMVRIFQKKHIIYKKDSFKAIKGYKNQRQAVLQNFAVLLGKIKHSIVSKHFSNFVNKHIKQLAATVKTAKQANNVLSLGGNQSTSNEDQKTLQKSKSQQVLSSSKLVKEESATVETQRLSSTDEVKLESKRKELERKANDLEKKKDSLQQELSNLNKQKRQKTKKNGELKLKLKELEKQINMQEENQALNAQTSQQKSKPRSYNINEGQIISVMTRIYAYLFQDPQNTQIVIERFLSDNQECFQLPTNSSLMNEWKIIKKNAELKRLIKLYEGEQPREKKIVQILQEENHLMGKLLRSFVRERYIWEWVNIIAHQ